MLSLNYHKFYEIYKKADNYLLTDENISVFERERKRQQLYNGSFELIMNDRYLYKIFNENSKNKIVYKRLSDFS
ncbi:hypothetical protein BUY33_08115 [Staphylococcus cohnii]|nr:hypothetical protein BUY26_09990 [Staphylococcus cohnii]RIL83979.1 hypothetical protein BUY33_08115 [Staphylococcus cohnii]